jgi:ribonuclease P protein subunit POP4
MPLTPETLTRHELNGLQAEVVDASNPDLVGIAGRVVVETMQTLHLDDGTRVRQVPKEGATFEFALPADGDTPRERGDSVRTDEAAGVRKAPGTASERGSETAGGNANDAPGQSGPCEGAAYVTVDGATLLSRPALRTENAGDSQWR